MRALRAAGLSTGQSTLVTVYPGHSAIARLMSPGPGLVPLQYGLLAIVRVAAATIPSRQQARCLDKPLPPPATPFLPPVRNHQPVFASPWPAARESFSVLPAGPRGRPGTGLFAAACRKVNSMGLLRLAPERGRTKPPLLPTPRPLGCLGLAAWPAQSPSQPAAPLCVSLGRVLQSRLRKLPGNPLAAQTHARLSAQAVRRGNRADRQGALLFYPAKVSGEGGPGRRPQRGPRPAARHAHQATRPKAVPAPSPRQHCSTAERKILDQPPALAGFAPAAPPADKSAPPRQTSLSPATVLVAQLPTADMPGDNQPALKQSSCPAPSCDDSWPLFLAPAATIDALSPPQNTLAAVLAAFGEHNTGCHSILTRQIVSGSYS